MARLTSRTLSLPRIDKGVMTKPYSLIYVESGSFLTEEHEVDGGSEG